MLNIISFVGKWKLKQQRDVYGSIIHNQKVETTQISTNWWINKMWYMHNGILFSNKKEWSTDTCHITNEPEKHVMCKKSATIYTYCIILFMWNF